MELFKYRERETEVNGGIIPLLLYVLKRKENIKKPQAFGLKQNVNIFNRNITEYYEERPIEMVSAFLLSTFYIYDGSLACLFLEIKLSLMSHLNKTGNHSQAFLGSAVNTSSIFLNFFFYKHCKIFSICREILKCYMKDQSC